MQTVSVIFCYDMIVLISFPGACDGASTELSLNQSNISPSVASPQYVAANVAR